MLIILQSMDQSESRPSSIKSIPRRSSEAQLVPNTVAVTTPDKSFLDISPLQTSDKRKGIRFDCLSDDTLDSITTAGRVSISLIDDDWSFERGK